MATSPHKNTSSYHEQDNNSNNNHADGDGSKTSSPVKFSPHDRLLGRGEILGLCLPAAAVQVGWTVGESLLIPYLLTLGVSNTVAMFAWLINPLFGLFLQPLCGHASDNCSSSFGRRRPFLFLFHLGSVCGLLTVVFACEILGLFGVRALGNDGQASVPLVALIFGGFATADMCHDLLLMPARALLNDQLPDEQTDQGNSYFALIASLGSIIGLCMVIAPLDTIYPLSLLGTPIRATFAVAAFLVMSSNIVSFFIAGPIDLTLLQLKERDEERDKMQRHTLNKNHHSTPAIAELSSPFSPVKPLDDSTSSTSPHNSTPRNENDESLLLSFNALGHLYHVVPRPLIVIWIGQFFFWYCVLHVNIWTTSYVPLDIFHARKGSAEFDHGVRWATIGLLVQAVTAFCASSLLTLANAMIGLTNWYHISAIIYGSSVTILWIVPSYPVFLVVMGVTGIALPAIYSSPFVLIEVHAADNEEEENDQTEEEAEKAKEHQEMDLPAVEKNEAIQAPESQYAYARPQMDVRKEHTEPFSPVTTTTNKERPVKSLALSTEHASPQIFGRAASYNAFSSSNQRATPSTAGSEREPLLRKEHEQISLNVDNDRHSDTNEDVVEEEFDMDFLDEWRGVLTGFYNITMVIAQIIVGLTSGVMIDVFGDIRVVFIWSGCIVTAVHLFVLVFGLSKPKVIQETAEEAAKRKQEEDELRQRETTQSSHPPLVPRPVTVPALPPIIDYGSLSTRAGRLRGRGAQPTRHARHASQYYHHHQQQPVQPQLRRSRSAPALVLLSRPKKVIRGVPVFQSHGVSAGSNRSKLTNERLKLERLRERTRLFSHLRSAPAVRRRHDKLADKHIPGSRPFHHVGYLSTQDEDEKRVNQGSTQSALEQKSNGVSDSQESPPRFHRALTTMTDGGDNDPVSIAVSDYQAENSAAEQAHQRSMWYSGMAAHQKAARLHDSALSQYQQHPYPYDGQQAVAMHEAEPHTPTAIFDFNADDLPTREVEDPTILVPAQALRESLSVPTDLFAQLPTPPAASHSILNTVLNVDEELDDAGASGPYSTR